jgi:hypothetical protein
MTKEVAALFAVNRSELLSYAGSVIVGDSNKVYYKPAPGRNRVPGLSAQY